MILPQNILQLQQAIAVERTITKVEDK